MIFFVTPTIASRWPSIFLAFNLIALWHARFFPMQPRGWNHSHNIFKGMIHTRRTCYGGFSSMTHVVFKLCYHKYDFMGWRGDILAMFIWTLNHIQYYLGGANHKKKKPRCCCCYERLFWILLIFWSHIYLNLCNSQALLLKIMPCLDFLLLFTSSFRT